MPHESISCFNPFLTNVSLLYPLKTSENQLFSDVFRGYRSGTLVENGSKQLILPISSELLSLNRSEKQAEPQIRLSIKKPQKH